MDVLIGMEYSGRTREAFRRKGHNAWSICDVPSEDNSEYHIIGNVLDHLDDGWDFAIFHPTCKYFNLAGIQWMYHPDDSDLLDFERRRHPDYPDRMDNFKEQVEVFKALQNCKIPKRVIENSTPHGLATRYIGKYHQRVQPWWFGDRYTKAACLWLYNTPPLVMTGFVPGPYEAECHRASPGKNRATKRARTYPGISNAFADQWGSDA